MEGKQKNEHLTARGRYKAEFSNDTQDGNAYSRGRGAVDKMLDNVAFVMEHLVEDRSSST